MFSDEGFCDDLSGEKSLFTATIAFEGDLGFWGSGKGSSERNGDSDRRGEWNESI